jgi:hypothetical protein
LFHPDGPRLDAAWRIAGPALAPRIKILIIEDDSETASFISVNLQARDTQRGWPQLEKPSPSPSRHLC